jgi:hypothetical protein
MAAKGDPEVTTDQLQDEDLAGTLLISAGSWRPWETIRSVDRYGASPSNLIYDRLASYYDTLHARFLRMAGGEAKSAMEDALSALLAPGMRILGAGCGTGQGAKNVEFGPFATRIPLGTQEMIQPADRDQDRRPFGL